MVSFPRFISIIGFDSLLEVIARLLKVKDGYLILGHLAQHHPAANLVFAQCLLLALDGVW
jgi:hypothetical protein